MSLLRAVDPDYATTDVGENRVDVVWFGDAFHTVGHFVLPAPAGLPSLANIVRDLRERLDLAALSAAIRGAARGPPRPPLTTAWPTASKPISLPSRLRSGARLVHAHGIAVVAIGLEPAS